MANYEPIGTNEKVPPYRPAISISIPDSNDRIGWDQHHRMWIFTQVRRRDYVCGFGFTHKTYWRTHWRQGREDWVACIHEVIGE